MTLFITASLIPKTNASQLQEARILGGYNSAPGDWPFMTALIQKSILQKNSQNSFCGGSYIGGRWVLTAAHCVKNKKGRIISSRNIKVNVGAQNLTTDRDNVINVSRIWVHPSFEYSTMAHDIALIKLQKQPSNVSPVTILDAYELAFANQTYEAAVILGRGLQRYYSPDEQQRGQEPAQTELFEAETQLIPKSMCNDAFNSFKAANNLSDSILKTDPVDESMTCAGSPTWTTDTCQGDSGGPLLVQYGNGYRLAGITSWGLGCGIPGLYSVYTKVPVYLDWIEGITDLSLADTDDNAGKSYVPSIADHEDSGGGALELWLIVLSGLLCTFRRYRKFWLYSGRAAQGLAKHP